MNNAVQIKGAWVEPDGSLRYRKVLTHSGWAWVAPQMQRGVPSLGLVYDQDILAELGRERQGVRAELLGFYRVDIAGKKLAAIEWHSPRRGVYVLDGGIEVLDPAARKELTN